MQMGYFTFANYLIQAFSGFGCCEIQQLSKLLVLYLWRWQEAPVSDTRNWVWGELLLWGEQLDQPDMPAQEVRNLPGKLAKCH